MRLGEECLWEISKRMCLGAETNAPSIFGFSLEESVAKSLIQWRHWVAGSVATQAHDECDGIWFCVHTGLWGGRTPLCVATLRAVYCLLHVSPNGTCPVGLQNTATELGSHVNNEELGYCRTKICLMKLKHNGKKIRQQNILINLQDWLYPTALNANSSSPYSHN